MKRQRLYPVGLFVTTLAGFAFVVATACAFAQESVKLAVSVVVAAQPDAPVRVVSIERRPQAEPLVTVENLSDVPVVTYRS